MPNINLMIKPASSDCNLRCNYCFYHDVASNRTEASHGFMSIETLEIIVRKACEYSDNNLGFTFQGGEPTLIGLNYFEKLIEFQSKYNKKNIIINNSIQTNGTLIDEKWAKFLKNNNFLVGLSLDGPKSINDRNRVDLGGKGSFNKIQATIDLFNKYDVAYNILSVVTKDLARHVEKTYNYFMKSGFKYLQFIPCLDDFNKEAGSHAYSLTSKDYGLFLKRLFDLWYRDFKDGKRISIRMFDNVMFMLSGYPPESCDMNGRCSISPVIESDGSIYPCDFYVLDEWNMGNITKNSFDEILKSDIGNRFIKISYPIYDNCKNCKYFALCRGGCRRHYEPILNNEIHKNYFCQAYKDFYDHSLDRFYEVLRLL